MLVIRALLLWTIISLHVVGGAATFRRWFPRESPWLGFIVPSLALVLTMNFVEHLVAIPSLLGLLPFTTLGFAWVLLRPTLDWKCLRLPTCIFLAAFAFTLTLRALKPDIAEARDGVVDLGLMSAYCMGAKVPPPLSWYPPEPLSHYYAFGHYGASVLTRLLGLDIGTGFNLSSALISSFDCLIAAAAAWTISRHKLGITILAPLMIECAGTGATSILAMTSKHFSPRYAEELQAGKFDSSFQNPLVDWLYLTPLRNELMPPGSWSWLGALHSTSSGQFLILFFTWCTAEVLRRRPSNWPWICLGAIPLITIVTSTWALPLEGVLLIGTVFWAWHYRLTPRSTRFVLLSLALIAVLTTPVLTEFLLTNVFVHGGWTEPYARTQFVEGAVLWWPIYLLWLALIFSWGKLPPAVRTVLVVTPLALLCIEFYTVDEREDWTGKLWGYVFGMAWITLFPALCRQRSLLCRGLTFLLILSGLVSFVSWTQFTLGRMDSDRLHLEGDGFFRLEPTRGPLLQALTQIKGKTILTGKSAYLYGEAPLLAAFTGNRIYSAQTFFCDSTAGGLTYWQANASARDVNDLYDGKCNDPLLFLRRHDIAALVIYPGDKIGNEVIDRLKLELAPYYEYSDFSTADVNSGIFVFHPEMMIWPTDITLPSSFKWLTAPK